MMDTQEFEEYLQGVSKHQLTGYLALVTAEYIRRDYEEGKGDE